MENNKDNKNIKNLKTKTCKGCGKELNKKATICPNCGMDQRNFFRKHKVITFFGIILILLVFNALTSTPEDKTPIGSTSALEIISSYNSNEIKANEKYSDKYYEITGVVKSVEDRSSSFIILEGNNKFLSSDLQCFFDDVEREDTKEAKKEMDKIKNLEEGNQITIIGKILGKAEKSLGNIDIDIVSIKNVIESPVLATRKSKIIDVTSKKLYNQYSNNKVKADKKYKNRTLKISGEIEEVTSSSDDCYITLKSYESILDVDELIYVKCYFSSKDEIERISKLNKGDNVSILGICEGYDYGDINIKYCVLN